MVMYFLKISRRSSFYKDFENGGFEELLSMYKDKKIVDSSDVFIFVKQEDDLKIVEWSNKNGVLTLIETEANNTLQQHQVGMEILRMLKTKYIPSFNDINSRTSLDNTILPALNEISILQSTMVSQTFSHSSIVFEHIVPRLALMPLLV